MKKHFLKLVIAVCALTGATTAQADQSIYEPYCFTNLAGLALNSGSTDNTGSLARFSEPWGVAVDSLGAAYVADTLNHTIRKITSGGVVTLLAGVPGSTGSANGANNVATFNRPTGVAVNSAGTVVYVADYNSHMIRQISGGSVTTLAGSGSPGTTDATGTSAAFRNPFGVALNSAGTLLYVSDQNNQTIRIITVPGGVVTTLAGSAGVNGYVDGANNVALFNTPRGIAVDGGGNVIVADAGNLLVRKITSGGFVTTLAGSLFAPGFNDGLGSGARFSLLQAFSPFGGPCGVAVDSAGHVYVTDQGNHTIRKITPAGGVTTLAGAVGLSGSADGTGIAARFNNPAGVAVDGAGRLYVADTVNHTVRVQCRVECACGPADEKIFISYNNGTIRQFDSGGVATTFATGLNTPKGLALGAGFLYVANSGANAILKFPTSGGGSSPFANTGLNGPYGLVFDNAGDLYAANYSSSTIQKLNGGTGLPVPPFPVTSPNMNGPFGLAVDSAGNFYAASHNNNTIQKFDSSGTFIGDLVSFTGGLSAPRGVAIRAGILYVANYIDSTIKMFDVTSGTPIGDFATAADGLLNPVGIAFDSAGNLYVANAGNNNVLKFTAAHVGSLFSNLSNQSPEFIAIYCEPSAILNIALYAGVTMQGSVGCQYRIDYTTLLNANPGLTVWVPLTTFTLASSPFTYVDTSTPASGTRFYRAVSLP